jgi:hypothetical protein
MTWEHRGELRADPGIAPGDRNIDPRRRRSLWSSIAVVAAIAAFGGVIWYAYHSGKDANRSGIPPLVKAETGPVKVKPDNPGGQEIPFQDSTVYDHLDKNSQKPVVEKLLPPPEEPIARPQPSAVPAANAGALPADAPPVVATTQLAPPLLPSAQNVAPLRQAAIGAPLTDVGAPTALAPSAGAIVIQPPAAAPPRPAVVPQAPKPTATAAPKPEPAKPAPPTSIAALINGAGGAAPASKSSSDRGSYRLQLSAVRSPDAVPEEWARLKRRFPELVSLKNSTNKIDVPGKGTFYRVEAGPLDESAAKSACTRLRGQGLGCIVVKH